jgi:hypothetical protein
MMPAPARAVLVWTPTSITLSKCSLTYQRGGSSAREPPAPAIGARVHDRSSCNVPALAARWIRSSGGPITGKGFGREKSTRPETTRSPSTRTVVCSACTGSTGPRKSLRTIGRRLQEIAAVAPAVGSACRIRQAAIQRKWFGGLLAEVARRVHQLGVARSHDAPSRAGVSSGSNRQRQLAWSASRSAMAVGRCCYDRMYVRYRSDA